ncbi:MAG: glycosyltransferase family 87 protein, partial [Ktedonobacterales bacterium]
MAAARWKRYGLLVGWGATLGAFIIGVGFSVTHNVAGSSDFGLYLTAANALRHDSHASIYSLSTLAATHAAYGGCAPMPGWGYLYQPLLALLLAPLSLASCGVATALWLALNVAGMLACAAWLVRAMWLWRGAGAALLAGALCALALPVYEGLYYGQVHILILGVCLGAVALMRRRHPRWAGALLAVGAFLKYLPALLLLYYLTSRQWGAALGAALGAVALGLLELVIVGPATLRASLLGGSGELLANIPRTGAARFQPYAMSILALGVVVVVTLALARWRGADTAAGLSLGEAWAIGAMAFVSPQTWYHYLTWLLPVGVALLGAALSIPNPRARKLVLAGLLALCALTFVNVPWPPPLLMGLLLWLVCTGVLLARVGVPVFGALGPALNAATASP